MLVEYEINDETLAILPYDINASEIIEVNKHCYVQKSPKEIIDDSCKYYGSSYQGRIEGTKKLTGFRYKIPIIIEESCPTIFFPTTSPEHVHCTWINLKNMKDYKSWYGGSLIKFKNGQSLALDISKFSLENQIFRASRLAQQLNDRKISKK